MNGRGISVGCLALAACGRVGFGALPDGGIDAPPDAPLDAYVCAPPYSVVSGGCYRVNTGTATWLAAEQQCEAEGAHLIIVNDIPEHFVLHTMLGDASAVASWVGYTDRVTEGSFQWVAPGGLDPAISTCFLGGIPNPAGADCVTQDGPNNCPDWNIIDCMAARPYVCEHDASLAVPGTY